MPKESVRTSDHWNTALHEQCALQHFSKLPFANADVRVVVGASRRRAAASKLRVTESRKRSRYSGDQKRERQCRARVLPGNRPNEDVHSGSNRRTNTW